MSLVGNAEGAWREAVFRSLQQVIYRVRGIVELNDAEQFGEGYYPVCGVVIRVMGIAGALSGPRGISVTGARIAVIRTNVVKLDDPEQLGK